MTIGPEPMTRTLLMSVRLRMRACSVSVCRRQDVGEPVEQVPGVVRTRGRLGEILHRERAELSIRPGQGESFDDVVVEADMAHLRLAVGRLHGVIERGVDGEPVVVRGDLDLAGTAVLHRQVTAPMAVTEL